MFPQLKVDGLSLFTRFYICHVELPFTRDYLESSSGYDSLFRFNRGPKRYREHLETSLCRPKILPIRL